MVLMALRKIVISKKQVNPKITNFTDIVNSNGVKKVVKRFQLILIKTIKN